MRLDIVAVTCGIRSKRILDDITVSLSPGVTCLLGPNGAGETSLLRIVATTLAPDSGEVRLDHNGAATVISRRRLGYVPQSFTYYPHFMVRQFVDYVAGFKQIPRGHRRNAVEDALEATDLVGHANQRLGTLSGGTLRRAAIAQAMVNDPEVLVLDEPTVGLDPSQRRAFLRLVGSVAENRIVILSTHTVEDVSAAAGHIRILKSGKIVFDGSPTELGGQGVGDALSTERLADGYERVLLQGVGGDV